MAIPDPSPGNAILVPDMNIFFYFFGQECPPHFRRTGRTPLPSSIGKAEQRAGNYHHLPSPNRGPNLPPARSAPTHFWDRSTSLLPLTVFHTRQSEKQQKKGKFSNKVDRSLLQVVPMQGPSTLASIQVIGGLVIVIMLPLVSLTTQSASYVFTHFEISESTGITSSVYCSHSICSC
ncbi:PREDICTED: uncharacterized protein LOC104585681 isoform X1 [Nelumbo nucifera]|uniref:Uncharacterized protein LOC104585681 isoform X1 n=1 Tax=Nelumbo nucifera TaxID=4432 RepID=A0A1U8QCN6_NELNU|nr:PREDICTED: uncharacterized protein LOC104585681 isoform X1 [Nelumbo nucifera]